MNIAQKKASNKIKVQILATCYEEDLNFFPANFIFSGLLQKSINQIVSSPKNRKLPLIGEIIENLIKQEPLADFYIYTNIDIILNEDFYLFIDNFLEKNNCDALIVNRKNVIDKEYKSLEEIFSAKTTTHPGFDCFIVKKEILKKFMFNNICVGVPFIGVNFAHNIFCFAQNPILLDNVNLTRHIGEDIFKHPRDEYYWHNRKCFDENIGKMWEHLDIDKFPYSKEFFILKYYKWAKNPSLFIFMNFKLCLRKFFKRK
jgi:hypothetical protein